MRTNLDDRRVSGRARTLSIASALAVLCLVVTSTPSRAYLRPGSNRQVDLTKSGAQPPADPERVSSTWGQDTAVSAVSRDGRYVVFDSAYPLLPEDVNLRSDIYLRDLKTDRLRLVSKGFDGTPAIGPGQSGIPGDPFVIPGSHGFALKGLSVDPTITPDGRFVAFASNAVNLVPGDTNHSADVFVYSVRKDRIEDRVSVDSKGDETGEEDLCVGTNVSVPHPCAAYAPSISFSGRYVSFTSQADDLVADDTNGQADVFVRDRVGRRTTRVSINSDGGEGHTPCPIEAEPPAKSVTDQLCKLGSPLSSISGNGRFVAFDSIATDLVEGDTNDGRDVFVHDLKKHTTERVSVATDGSQAEMYALQNHVTETVDSGLSGGWPSRTLGVSNISESASSLISADGRYVAFYSNANDLVPNDNVNGHEVFVRDRETGRTERVTVSSDGRQPRGIIRDDDEPSMSADGRYVTWTGGTTALDDPTIPPEDADGSQAYIFDRRTGTTEVASVSDRGAPAAGCEGNEKRSYQNLATVNPSGRFVSFMGCAENLHPDNKDEQDWRMHIFVHDRGALVSSGGWGSSQAAKAPPDETGICVSDVCLPPLGVAGVNDRPEEVPSLITRRGADLYGASVAYRPGSGDLFVRVQLEQMPLVASDVAWAATLYGLRFTAGGVRYEVRVQRTPADVRGTSGASFGLFRCEGSSCSPVGNLFGGYGTTGDEVVFSLPLRAVGLAPGGAIDDVEAFSALGRYHVGPLKILDTVRFR